MNSGQDEHLFYVLITLGVQCNIFNSGVLQEVLAPETAAAQRLEDPFLWRCLHAALLCHIHGAPTPRPPGRFFKVNFCINP